jgi:hypothetical protein
MSKKRRMGYKNTKLCQNRVGWATSGNLQIDEVTLLKLNVDKAFSVIG